MEWISVEDKLPEESADYLVWVNNFDCEPYIRIEGYLGDFGFTRKTITHWMPLPDPPKGE